MPKIAFIGAGSINFSRKLMTDILSFPGLSDVEFAMMDIDTKRLGYTERIAKRIIKERKSSAKFFVTTDRKKALDGADYVITMILVGGIDAIRPDIEIPLKYGVDQCIGDTLGPGGIFRALRTIPVMLDICRDIEEVCPDAWLLNYTNPMAMLCWAINDATKVKCVGLCHSAQVTAKELAKTIGIPVEEITHWVAGINHQAWFLELKHKGRDLYPVLKERIKDPDVYNTDTARCEMFKHLGYFVTESSGHNSEYNPWFRKRTDLLKRYTPGGEWNGGSGFILKLYGEDRENYEEELEKIASGKIPLDLMKSHEYASEIINSLDTGIQCRINGNVRNNSYITNLPDGCCVEVPCYVDNHGVNPSFIGDLPLQLAVLNRTNISVQELAVKAALTGDRRTVFHAVAFDPLTSAVLSLQEIQNMVDEMFEAERTWLPQF